MTLQKETLDKTSFEKDLTKLISKHGLSKLQKHYSQLLTGKEVPIDKSNVEIPCFREIKDMFISRIEDTKRDQTSRTYKSEINYFGLFLLYKCTNGLNTRITEVMTPSYISEYLSFYSNRNTRNKKCAVLRSFLKNECINHLDPKRIKHLLEVLKREADSSEKDIPKAFLPNQIQFLLNESKNTQADFRNYAMIWTFLGSGIRNNELVNIQIGDISIRNQKINVLPKGKSTKQSRYITQVALRVLMDYINFKYDNQKKTLSKEKYEKLYVFSKDGQKAMSTDTVRDIVDRLIKKGVQKGIFSSDNNFSPHSFRHSFALYALEQGISIYKIKEYLGHSSIKSTEIYLELYDSQMVNTIEKHPFAQIELSYLKQKEDFE